MTWDNLSDPIFDYAATRPAAPALVDGPTALDYRTFAELVGKAAVYLDRLGVREGERVGVNLSSGIDHVILAFALLRVGATLSELHYASATPLDPALLGRFGIGRVFIEANAAAPATATSIRVDAAWRARIGRESGDHRTGLKGESLQLLSMSSGSTGLPKGVVTTQRLIFDRQNAYEAILGDSGVYSPDRPANFLLTASLSHNTFLRRVIAQFCAGGPVVLLPEYAHPVDLIKVVVAWDNVSLAAMANMCRAFIAAAPLDAPLFPNVRALTSVGMPLFPEEKRAIVRRVTPNFYDSYGATGIGTISCLLPSEVEAKADSVGRAAPEIELEIVDAKGEPCAPGTLGRLRCRGKTAIRGFEGATETPGASERFADGWYYPGEFGSLDADGFLYLKGRAAEVVRRSGIELFPSDVEEALASHPGVREVAVVGVPSPAHGEDVVAVVVKNGNPSHDELAQHCRARLTPEKWPDRIFYAGALPKMPGGKPDRTQVRTMVLDEIARRQKSGTR
jgi:long-chain acyl-CoA synthetase